jgi:hypothetical protein
MAMASRVSGHRAGGGWGAPNANELTYSFNSEEAGGQ